MQPLRLLLLLLLLLLFPLSVYSQPPNDAISLLAFKAKADLDNTLGYTSHSDFCLWPGVKCNHRRRVVRLALSNSALRGTFAGDTLTNLHHLSVLILRNNSLSGPLPDLSPLSNLQFLDLSFNNFSGVLPTGTLRLNRLYYLNLQFNRFNGSLPPLNQSHLQFFNVTGNYFSGRIPATTSLSKFPSSSFRLNPNLCGEIIAKPCGSDSSPLFDTSSATMSNQPSLNRSIPSVSESILSPPSQRLRHKRGAMVLGFSVGALFLTSLLCVFLVSRKRRKENAAGDVDVDGEAPASETTETEVVRFRLDSQNNELKEKVERVGIGRTEKGGNNYLVFCMGEGNMYTLDQLMKAKAEMLGIGTMGTTYKAELDNQMILTVKRLDGIRMTGLNGEIFERHMVAVGSLRHPNLVPMRAYFQAKQERLIIYDYLPNGSVHNLIHGSRSARAKPLHWTSCLKIAEDVAQGLCYIHQASKLVHGNLKSSNVLLGADFEACIADYCLATLATYSNDGDPDSAGYRVPEGCKPGDRATSEYDVYAFGVLLLELLSGTPPSQHPILAPEHMPHWVKVMRGDDDNSEDTQLGMLVEVASLCSVTSPEHRPEMWQVLRMIQKIKAIVCLDAFNPSTEFS